MQHLTLHIGIALLTFAISMTATKLWSDFFTPEVKTLITERAVGPLAPMVNVNPAKPTITTHTVTTHSLTFNGGVLNRKAISKPAPAYPPIAKAAGAQGTVTVQILVDETGNVISAMAVSGHPLLQAAAVAAAKKTRFPPTMLSGLPVKITGVITYNFVLNESERR